MAAPGLRVGVLGGSFNPAHDGHLHISLLALKQLQLDEVWWMVSPQNPLKSTKDMAPFDERLVNAEKFIRHPGIRVTDIESRLGTRYTADTLAALKFAFPRVHFVWLMGADNLAQMSRWRRWTRIFNLVPIAVFDRAPYSFDALAGKAAQAFSRFKLRARNATDLVERTPPAWIFFHTRLHPGSATLIRARRIRREKSKTQNTKTQNT
jgi:nicotinate-nucleotide adenylyltransferase